tara:strand:- start:104 stop:301 length:198 start_codon:yes stop_codon:yes gene_type:complete
MSDLQVKPNIENGDLPKQLELDFNKKSKCTLSKEWEETPQVKQLQTSFDAFFGGWKININNTKKE